MKLYYCFYIMNEKILKENFCLLLGETLKLMMHPYIQEKESLGLVCKFGGEEINCVFNRNSDRVELILKVDELMGKVNFFGGAVTFEFFNIGYDTIVSNDYNYIFEYYLVYEFLDDAKPSAIDMVSTRLDAEVKLGYQYRMFIYYKGVKGEVPGNFLRIELTAESMITLSQSSGSLKKVYFSAFIANADFSAWQTGSIYPHYASFPINVTFTKGLSSDDDWEKFYLWDRVEMEFEYESALNKAIGIPLTTIGT